MVPAVGADEVAAKWKVTEGCEIYQDTTKRSQAKCFRAKDGRLFEIYDAVDTSGEGFSGTVTVALRFKNPDDNWDDVGFKIKTYELTAAGAALADKLEGDAVVPTLQCQSPCEECKSNPPDVKKLSVTPGNQDGFVFVDAYVRDYCTKCW